MSEIREYKCPCCSGKLEFSSDVQKMKCPFCESEFDMETVQDYNDQLNATSGKEDDMNWSDTPDNSWSDSDAASFNVYSCKSCGGEIIADETTGATKCPYCDNPVVLSGQFSGDLRPDMIIPFKLDKNAAKSALMKHMEGKRLLPKVFKEENHIDEIKGVYVPVWLFDTDSNADILYRCEKVRVWSDQQFDYTERSYYQARRTGKIRFEKVPVDGSEKMPDDLMESIEPFNIAEAVEFKTAYLSGYLADKYDVDSKQSIERANKRIKHSTEQEFARTVVGYDNVSCQGENIRFSDGSVKYALYPVWILNTTWNNNKYIFAMNGQTGKFVGDLPSDKKASLRWFILIAIIAAIICFILYQLISDDNSPASGLVSAVVGALSGGIGTGKMRSQLNTVHEKSGASDYTKEGSLALSVKEDSFLNKRIDKTPRANNVQTQTGAGIHTSNGSHPVHPNNQSHHNSPNGSDNGNIIHIGDLMKK